MTDPDDLRSGGRWALRQRAKNDALWLLASLALGACRPLPASVLRWLGRRLGLAAVLLAPGARRTALANLARVFPALRERERQALVRRCFATLGEVLGETVAMLGSRPVGLLEIDAPTRRVFQQALAEGRGVVFASAHLGPWERVAASLAAAGVPLVVLARESYDPRFTRLYARLRERHGLEVIWRGEPGAAARILRTLRGNRVLGVPMDLRSRVASCEAPFLGHGAPTAIGPARLALRTGAPVVVGSAIPASGGGDGRVEVTATPVQTAGLPGDMAGARELTCRMNAEISRRILAFPHGWVWMHERWATRTEDDSPG
jgi:KDO2-lipid IV(A) lauroyltransferase